MERRASPPVSLHAPYCSKCLTPNESRIQAARNGRVSRSLNDRPAVGKQRHLVRLTPELQYKLVVPNVAQRLKPRAQLRKIYRPFALVDLHRIPAAHRNVRPPFARQMDEVSQASSTSRPRMNRSQLRPLVRPHIP